MIVPAAEPQQRVPEMSTPQTPLSWGNLLIPALRFLPQQKL